MNPEEDMSDHPTKGNIKFVTSNEHKFLELQEIFRNSGINLEWIRKKYEEIQGEGTEEISLDSARKITHEINGRFFLEDTGLYIDALNGFPGPYSSYVAGTIGNTGILKLIQGLDRSCRFLTVITYFDGHEFFQFDGTLRGSISKEIRGKGGFGYDPIFIPDGQSITLAEMDIETKSSISHRSLAAQRFISHLMGSR